MSTNEDGVFRHSASNGAETWCNDCLPSSAQVGTKLSYSTAQALAQERS